MEQDVKYKTKESDGFDKSSAKLTSDTRKAFYDRRRTSTWF